MPLSQHAVRWYGQSTGGGRQLGCIGIEDQQHLVAATVKQMPAFCLGKGNEPQRLVIEPLGAV